MDLGPHAPFIIWSYLIGGGAIALLAFWIILDGRTQRRLLDDLDRDGIRRRSDAGEGVRS